MQHQHILCATSVAAPAKYFDAAPALATPAPAAAPTLLIASRSITNLQKFMCKLGLFFRLISRD
jgi:hypothetical protein